MLCRDSGALEYTATGFCGHPVKMNWIPISSMGTPSLAAVTNQVQTASSNPHLEVDIMIGPAAAGVAGGVARGRSQLCARLRPGLAVDLAFGEITFLTVLHS
jgi:hypothetical protein